MSAKLSSVWEVETDVFESAKGTLPLCGDGRGWSVFQKLLAAGGGWWSCEGRATESSAARAPPAGCSNGTGDRMTGTLLHLPAARSPGWSHSGVWGTNWLPFCFGRLVERGCVQVTILPGTGIVERVLQKSVRPTGQSASKLPGLGWSIKLLAGDMSVFGVLAAVM